MDRLGAKKDQKELWKSLIEELPVRNCKVFSQVQFTRELETENGTFSAILAPKFFYDFQLLYATVTQPQTLDTQKSFDARKA